MTRAKVVLEMASEMLAAPGERYSHAMALLRSGSSEIALFGSNSHEGIEAVVNRRAALAIVNPSAQLAFAYKGSAPYSAPQPVRTIAVIPSLDQFAFVVRKETGLTSFEDIARKRQPLKVSVRGQKDHSLHFILEHVMQAAGFSSKEFLSWGGELRKEGSLPYPDSAKFSALARGEIDAIFDEGIDLWLQQALALDVKVLGLSEETIRKVEAKGCRRAVIEKSRYPRLPGDVLTVDFSGWPIFVHADAPDSLVTQFCTALEARKDRIPWQGDGPLPTDRMCRDLPENPLDVPLHPAAERFWRGRGYLP